MVQAAKLSYDLDMSMSDIGKEIGLTRWQVGRLLKDARELGIVRIDIVPDCATPARIGSPPAAKVRPPGSHRRFQQRR